MDRGLTRPVLLAVAGAVVAFTIVLAVAAVGEIGLTDTATKLAAGGWFAGAVGIGLFVVLVTMQSGSAGD
jgi:K+ transporter